MYDDLRGFVEHLKQEGEVVTVTEALSVKYEIAAAIKSISEKDGRVALFNQVKDYPGTVVGNLLGSKRRLAMAIGVDETALAETYLSRRKNLIKPSMVGSGPIKENIISKDIDILKTLPVLTHHEKDAGPYFTSGVIISKDPETGARSMGIHRIMVRAPRGLGIFVNSPPLSNFLENAEKKGVPLEIAVVLGQDPVTFFSSVVWAPEGIDKFSIAGALARRPVSLVKCESVDLEVPANAEFVLEGRILPGERLTEGPFGESTGYYLTYNNPVAEIQVITHRNQPVYNALMPFAGEDEVLLDFAWGLENKHVFLQSISGLKDLRLRYIGLMVVAQVKKRDEKDGQRIIRELMDCGMPNKVIVAVDEDVDIQSDKDIWWAIATRFQPDRDTIIKSNMPGLSIDPSTMLRETVSSGVKTLITETSKIGMDATKPLSDADKFEKIRVPPDVAEKVEKILSGMGLKRSRY